jgi:hypothetical protein
VAEWSAWQVIAGLLSVLGIGALIAWWFREFLLAYLPRLNPARVGRAARRRDDLSRRELNRLAGAAKHVARAYGG